MAAREHFFVEDLAQTSHSNTTATPVATLTFTPSADTSYLILYSCQLELLPNSVYPGFTDGAGTEVMAVNMAGVQVGESFPWKDVSWSQVVSFGASPAQQSFELTTRVSSGNLTSKNHRIVAIALTSDDARAEAPAVASTTSGTFQTGVTHTFTPPAAEDYLVIGSAKIIQDSLGAPSEAVEARLNVNGSPVGVARPYIGGQGRGSTYTYATVASLPNASTTLSMEYRSVNGDTVKISNQSVIAIRLSNFSAVQYGRDATDESTTSTTLQAAGGSVTFTPSARKHLIFASAIGYNATANDGIMRKVSGQTEFLDSNPYWSDISSNRALFSSAGIRTLTANSATWGWEYSVESGDTGAAHLLEKDIVVLDLEESGTGGGTLTTTTRVENKAGTALANETGISAWFYENESAAPTDEWTGETTDANGDLALDYTNAAGTEGTLVIQLANGNVAVAKVTPA